MSSASANCEVCGKEVDEIITAKIESSLMKVCRKCARLGKVVEQRVALGVSSGRGLMIGRSAYAKKLPYERHEEKEDVLILVDNYGRIIQKAREKLSLTQEKLAAMLNEKASVISRVESGHMRPSEKLARKLERMLKIKIVEGS